MMRVLWGEVNCGEEKERGGKRPWVMRLKEDTKAQDVIIRLKTG